MKLNKNRHSVYKLQYHLIITTKYRHKIFNIDIDKRIKEISYNIFEKKWDCEIIAIETDKDHIHIAFEGKPQIELTKLINNYKTVSSRLIRKEFSEYLNDFYWEKVFWSPSYCLLSSGGATIEVIKEYIENQKY